MQHSLPTLRMLPIDQLVRGKYQPRVSFDQTQLEELAQSIRSSGLLQPIVTRPLAQNQYEIIAGERRWRAAQLAGLHQVPCVVNDYDDAQAAEAAAIENINRVNLNPVEEANAYQRLIDEFSYTHEELAAVIGKNRTHITNMLRLLKLDDRVQLFLITDQISEGHGKVLAGIPMTHQFEVAQKAIDKNWSVRQLELETKKYANKIGGNNSEKDPNLVKLEGALSDHLGSPVKIDYESNKGKLQIEFHNLEILEGIFGKMGFKVD